MIANSEDKLTSQLTSQININIKVVFSMTYDYTNGFCGLYRDCNSINTNECAQCISGEEQCCDLICNTILRADLKPFYKQGPVTCDYIQCNIPGQCVGILEYQQTATTLTDCEVSSIYLLKLLFFAIYHASKLRIA